MHAVVVGTVMVDPVLVALRRVAQEAVSAQRAGGAASAGREGTASEGGRDEGPVLVDRAFVLRSPDGIRTRATALRGRSGLRW